MSATFTHAFTARRQCAVVGGMPSFDAVGEYLEINQLEAVLSDAVAICVEEERPQPLAAIADMLYERAAALAVAWDYGQLTADVRGLIEREKCGPVFVQLAFADAATYSAALGGGGPNAALRFADRGEGAFPCNAFLAKRAVPLLEPIKAQYPNISRADLWAHAANVAIEALGGPSILSRFGRRDAATSADSVPSAAGRLPDDLASGAEASPSEHMADHLRVIFHRKGFTDREIVALCGRHTLGEYEPPNGAPGGGPWTEHPNRFDNSYYVELLSKKYEPSACGSAGVLLRSSDGSTIMLPTDHALLRDPKLRAYAEKYASDSKSFFADFAAAWEKLLELGCTRLAPHPASLTYASSCVVPCEWLELPLRTRRDHTHDTAVYGFGLPEPTQTLRLPACACLLVRAPARGKEGRDAMRAYFPTSDPGLQGTFELMVRRGSEPPDEVAAWLHELPIGSKVAFRHPALCLKEQYPFEGKERFNMLAGGMGLAPMYQILWKMLFTPADERKAVLIYHSRTTADILLRRELDEWARALPHRLTVVHVVGDAPDAAPPEGWKTTDTYVAESGEVDKAKLSKYAFAPSKETLCFICGPPALYTALCGPREERALRQGTVLDQLGYTSSMIAKL